MANANKRPKAVLSTTNPRKIGDFMIGARAVIVNIGNNANIFTSPSPTLESVTAALTDLETAEGLAHTRVAGSVAARDLKYNVLLKALYGLLSYVQNLADNAVDEATAISIINASGFGLKSTTPKSKPILTALNGDVSGTVELIAKAAGTRASYNWRKSDDNVTWTDLSPTLQAKTSVAGLTPASIVYFQCRAVTKTGAGNWSHPISIVVQ